MCASSAALGMNPLFWFVLLSFLVCSWCDGNTSIDVDCLLEFKKGIRKDPLGHVMNTWVRDALGSDGCPQNWHGIECNGGLVTNITLTGLGLVGDLKFFTLYGLKSLRELDLSNNLLTGRLVPAIGTMYSLQRLDLSSNLFYGPIPGRISALWGLTHLNLSVNNFSGSVPEGVENLQQLKVVDLHSNNLRGEIASLLSRLRRAEHVDLSWNMFSGDAGNFSSFVGSVRHLNLGHNQLSGEFFTEDASLVFTKLELLDVSDNQLTGTVPSFESVSSLRVLRLQNNRFYGSVPRNLLAGGSNVLVEIDLSGNAFSGSINTVSAPSLKIMNLSSNSISGTLPSEIRSCTIVDLSKNMISGNLSVLRTWSDTIEVIDLSSNSLSGTFPSETSTFPNLTIIKLTNNSLEGTLPPLLGSFSKLTVVDLSLNKFSGPIFSDLFMLPSVIRLQLSGNKFTGPILLQRSHISSSVGLDPAPLSQLTTLDLSHNLFDGLLPPEIGNMTALTSLNLGKNYFSGEIPNEISKLKSLEYLDLSLNNFSGSIPNVFPSNLKFLNISYNDLSGYLPECLRKFPQSCFYPGNSLLSIPDHPAMQYPTQGLIYSEGETRHSTSGRKAAIVVGSIRGAIVIAVLFVLVHYRAQLLQLGFQNGCNFGILSESINRVRYTHANSFRFSHGMDRVSAQSNYPACDCPPPSTVKESQQKEFDSDMGSRSPEHTKGLIPEFENVPDRSPNSGRSSPGSHFSSPALHRDAITHDQPVMLYAYSPDRLSGDLFFLDSSLIFTADELSRAPAEVLGRSSHGTSYKATLDGGHVLTVKWLREGLVKRKKDFAKEAKRIGTIRHPNIVPLRGYYWGPKEHEKLIISDYISAESLADHLYVTSPRRYPPLSFSKRLKIAVDVGRCLCYLHCEKGLPHGNLKTTNILLEHPDLTVKLTDYSIHRLMTASSTADHILNLGALGYRAPELASSSKPCPTLKADVYSFGAILMELLTGKSAGEIISGNSGAVDLTDWVQLCASQSRIIECYDPDIVGNILVIERYPKEIDEALAVSLRCILPVNERPDMKSIFEQLCSIEPV